MGRLLLEGLRMSGASRQWLGRESGSTVERPRASRAPPCATQHPGESASLRASRADIAATEGLLLGDGVAGVLARLTCQSGVLPQTDMSVCSMPMSTKRDIGWDAVPL